jgi:Domain of unknown function DUF11/Kelch motif
MLLTGTWTPLTNLAAAGVQRLALLSNGSVIIPRSVTAGTQTQLLTPDASGSYVNGTWSVGAGFTISGRLGSTAIVLPDGRLMLFGGVDTATGTEYNDGQIYDPVANTWTSMASFPESTFGNGPTELLANGQVLAGSTSDPNTYLYNPATNTWSAGPTKLSGDSSLNESWTLLPDGSILSYDVNGNPGEAQRLDPTTMSWVDAGAVPVALEAGISAYQTMGPGVLLPDGQVLQLGRSSQTAIYTPPTPGDGTNGVGSWTAGPVIPNGLETGGENSYDGSTAAVLPNGHVLFCADLPDTGGPTKFFEFDPTAPLATSLTDITPPITGYQTNSVASATRLLLLPTGQVLLGNSGAVSNSSQLYVYTPDGAPQAAWKPTITSVVASGNNYVLTGTQLNGVSAGASHGTSTQTATNFPIIELTSAAGKVYFARTFNWSSTGVATGSTPETTDFTLPAGLPLATYQLTVIANGIASTPFPFTGGVTGADLAVVQNFPIGLPATFNEGDTISTYFTVTNYGPSASTKAVATVTMGANWEQDLGAATSQGTFKRTGNVVTFNIGSIAVGQSVNLLINAQALATGNLTMTAAASGKESDPNTNNNTTVATDTVIDPPIVVSGPITVTGKNQSNVQVATFTHANGVDPASDFIATINWGDGSSSTGSITESGTTYKVKGSHTYATNSSHTVATTVVEASSGGGSMSALTVVNTSPPTNSTDNKPAAMLVQPVAATTGPPQLKTTAIDQVLSTTALNRSRHTHHSTVNNTAIDDLFALD